MTEDEKREKIARFLHQNSEDYRIWEFLGQVERYQYLLEADTILGLIEE